MATTSRNTALLDRAITIATTAHHGQLDKAGKPYILHPIRVMLQGQTEDEMILGILHDVIEDTDLTIEDIRKEGFPEHILTALALLTHNPADSYDDYIHKLAPNPLALRVKLYDLHDNMNRARLEHITQPDENRLAKYQRAKDYLLPFLEGNEDHAH